MDTKTALDEMNVAMVAALFAEPARAAMLTALLDRRSLPAGELAYRAGITPQTASAHLAKLLDGGLLCVETCGRHRYYHLAGSEVAHVIEALSALAPRPPGRAGPREDARRDALCHARTCYDHLAGGLGVALAEALVSRGLLELGEAEFSVTPIGALRLREWGIDVDALRREKRAFARRCLDWTERRHHIAGALGTALLGYWIRQGWIARVACSRAVLLTDSGRAAFREELGMRYLP